MEHSAFDGCEREVVQPFDPFDNQDVAAPAETAYAWLGWAFAISMKASMFSSGTSPSTECDGEKM